MIPIKIKTQPDDTTCGPTCLQAVYSYYGEDIPLKKVIRQVSSLEGGGTLAVMLGDHALLRGYDVSLYTYNLKVFDPTWFPLRRKHMVRKLKEQLLHKKGQKFEKATYSYIDYLRRGGRLYFEDLTPSLLESWFKKKIPVLAGLSATYLYRCARELDGTKNRTVFDDVRGYPSGHFVILCGFDRQKKNVIVADPYKENPVSGDNIYSVEAGRLINAIMLGIVTYDSNLLIIKPRRLPA